jgi:hypothetical protein
MKGILRILNSLRGGGTGRGRLRAVDEQYVLARAYVPEHIVSLMALISKGRPFLIEDHVGFVKDNWLILVGYPLEQEFSLARCEQIVKQVVESHRPEYLWFIGPEIPPALLERCQNRQTDQYYRLDLAQTKPKSSLRRVAQKAGETLIVARTRTFSREHLALVAELRQRQNLPPLIEALYEAMPDYVAHSASACVLEARDKKGKLGAFYVVELAAPAFDTYILGSHSKTNYMPHASDRLFLEMITLAQERGKQVINLGLGVNEGISRFKKKWGGKPFLQYEFCEFHYEQPQARLAMEMLLDRK